MTLLTEKESYFERNARNDYAYDGLDLAREEGKVHMQRPNGEALRLTPLSKPESSTSPLDGGYVEPSIPRDQIVHAIRKGQIRA